MWKPNVVLRYSITKNVFFFQFDLQLVNNVYTVMTKDSLLTSHAISTPIDDPDDIPQFFDSISYDKVSSFTLPSQLHHSRHQPFVAAYFSNEMSFCVSAKSTSAFTDDIQEHRM